MDNFFQILFILFIIFSFLAPLFKKKPEEQQKSKPQRPVDDNSNLSTSRPSTATSEREDVNYDIMKEIEGMFNQPAETVSVEEQNVSETTEAEDENYKSPEWHEPSKSEEALDTEWHRPTTAADYEKEQEFMDEKAKEFEKLLNKKVEINLVARNIRNSIKNPETLKEYFVISEIIGKPRGFEIY